MMSSKARLAVAAGAFLSMPLAAAAGVSIHLGGRRSCRRIASVPLVLESGDETAKVAVRLPGRSPEELPEPTGCEAVEVEVSLVDGGTGELLKGGRKGAVPSGGGAFFEFDLSEFEPLPDAISADVRVLPAEGSEGCGVVQALATLQVRGASGRQLAGFECVGKATRFPDPVR